MDSRWRSILAGIILGFILGFWIYVWPGYFLVSGPIEGYLIPEEVRMEFLADALKFGLIPGALIGFIGGLVLPFHQPRAYMAKSIAASCWIPITVLAWITQWSNLEMMSGGRIAITIGVTLFSFFSIFSVSEQLSIIEKIRED
ncbi:MAG: hypothetical protein ABIB55_02270 [Candidatus Nealsonbacteria bacterium]